jgi:protein tyrosine/serine phosphatase
LLEIRTDSLRFNNEEAWQILQLSTVYAVDTATAATLNQHIEGWAAGLQLAALSFGETSHEQWLEAFQQRPNEFIADPANRPLVFHCSHGVDRTGTGAAILLSALGVLRATGREDFLLSNEYRHDEVEKRLAQLQHMAAQKQGVAPGQVDMDNMDAFLIQNGSYIDASQDEVVKAFGSMALYIQDGLGLSRQELRQLQETLLFP